jgi:hypothetical protein
MTLMTTSSTMTVTAPNEAMSAEERSGRSMTAANYWKHTTAEQNAVSQTNATPFAYAGDHHPIEPAYTQKIKSVQQR